MYVYLNYQFMLFYMILFKMNKSMNLSYISFYKSNGHIELWMTVMESFDPIRQRRAIFAYFRKQISSSTMVKWFNPEDTLHKNMERFNPIRQRYAIFVNYIVYGPNDP